MKICLLKLVSLCAILLLCSFKGKETSAVAKKKTKAGVVLSFDDAYINEWHATDKKLKKYHWKGTFFVSKIHSLSEAEIKKLLALQHQGHEIAAHSYNHLNAVKFLKNHSINDYFQTEIYPMQDLMAFYGFKVSSFAYPYGARTKKLDKAMLQQFKTVRGRAFTKKKPAKQGTFYDDSNLVFSFSIDYTNIRYKIPHLLKLLDYAKTNNKILILNGHQTIDTISGDYQTKNATVAYVCDYIKKNNMNFYTFSELQKLRQPYARQIFY